MGSSVQIQILGFYGPDVESQFFGQEENENFEKVACHHCRPHIMKAADLMPTFRPAPYTCMRNAHARALTDGDAHAHTHRPGWQLPPAWPAVQAVLRARTCHLAKGRLTARVPTAQSCAHQCQERHPGQRGGRPTPLVQQDGPSWKEPGQRLSVQAYVRGQPGQWGLDVGSGAASPLMKAHSSPLRGRMESGRPLREDHAALRGSASV